MFSRITKGIIASFYGQGVTLLFQFISVPLFISNWGVNEYGQWLTIFAIPMTLSMLDFGFFSVIGNKISNAIQNKDNKLACNIINSVFSLIAIVYGVMLITLIMASGLYNINYNFPILFCLVSYSTLILFANFYVSIFRANREYHIGSFLINTARLIECVFVLAALLFTPTMLEVSLVYLISRIITSLFIFCYFRIRNSWYKLESCQLKYISRKDLNDSLDYALMPIAFILNNQGSIFLLNAIAGNAQVAIFVTARTYFRLTNNIVTAITNSSWQEINYTANEGNRSKLAEIMRLLNRFTYIISISSSTVLMILFEYILGIWTRGEINYNFHYSALIMLSTLVFSLWQPYHVFLSAIGDYRNHTKVYFILQVLLITLSYFSGFGFTSFLITSILIELIMLIASHRIYERRLKFI